MRTVIRTAAVYLAVAAGVYCEVDGAGIYREFVTWKAAAGNAGLGWEAAIEKYEARLRAGGMQAKDAARALSIIAAHDEGTYYDPVYAGKEGKFPTHPSRLLMEAVAERKPGRALDIGMGQGRNAVFLAKQGWEVTGFDTSQKGLAAARKAAAEAGVSIRAVHASDEEFDFGVGQWDLIALLYPIEKRSVFRVREALKPGGVVVVECSHKEGANAAFEYDTNELLQIFSGFKVMKYEDGWREHEWVGKRLRIVRLIAVK